MFLTVRFKVIVSSLFITKKEKEIHSEIKKKKLEMSQVSQECCICYRTAIDQYITPCGHFGCIQCFLGRGINLINNSPEPHCPVCHLPVLWLAPCKTLNTASQENLSEAAARAEPSFHPPPCAGGVFLHHVSICDQCAAQHPNPYDEAVLTVPL